MINNQNEYDIIIIGAGFHTALFKCKYRILTGKLAADKIDSNLRKTKKRKVRVDEYALQYHIDICGINDELTAFL